MQNLNQLLKNLTPIIIALVIAFVAWRDPHISASKVDAWGVKADHIELSFTRNISVKPAQTTKPTAIKVKHKARKHP
ncbi:hypothetical protein N4G41_25060 [Kosakonia sacchari]|uniref:hypothetical protein n=1 Tax=Kosakonia sacchari TaxID=1158459 RepID=UPI002ACD78E7|nr:hypothetical protein [Kosakonia sacchari]MDZ7324906.1 hypothetical protein [Kosakonia sacchari]